MFDNPTCERCGGATVYVGNVTAPHQTIYGCAKCGQQTWVKDSQQRQPQPDKPKE